MAISSLIGAYFIVVLSGMVPWWQVVAAIFASGLGGLAAYELLDD